MNVSPSARAFVFAIEGDAVVGILHPAQGARDLGVVLVVGGPQYRVGSHRQFVLLARRVAEAGWPVLRFDARGMGDAGGEPRTFGELDADIRTAIDELQARSTVVRVVLWGLCDAASAIMMYAHGDPRVAGVVLLNPWVHSPATEAKVRLKHYYRQRLASADLWRKLVRFEIDWRDSLGSLLQHARSALRRRAGHGGSGTQQHFIERMRQGWAAFGGPTLLILSGDDITAGEFRELCADDPAWRPLSRRSGVHTVEMAAANHTFARADWRRAVEDETCRWLNGVR